MHSKYIHPSIQAGSRRAWFPLLVVWAVACLALAWQAPVLAAEPRVQPPGPDFRRWARPDVASLRDLSIDALRSREYASELTVVSQLGTAAATSEYSQYYAGRGSKPHETLIAEYRSDGNRVYTRIDIPAAPMPAQGYPVVIFLHGWYSNEDAPGFDFSYRPSTLYADTIEAYVAAGFLVLYPGWRGYGTVNGKTADGAEFLEAWNNGSYVMPTFFAIDVLNLLEGLKTLERTDWRRWRGESAQAVRIDPRRIHIAGHSQGGDVVLTVLAVAGEGSRVRATIASGSIWAGCFPSRFQQVETYGPMASTAEAFLAGDGTWTGTATGRNGAVNPNFVFGWPPDSIVTVDTQSPDWARQAARWPLPTVADALRQKYAEMYDAVNRHAADVHDAKFEVRLDRSGKASVSHDPRVTDGMRRIGGFAYPQYLKEPLILHFSDRDYYSTPAWNEDLSRRINAAGGHSVAFVYPGNTHSLGKSRQPWFSPTSVVPGFRYMLERDIELFSGRDPAGVRYPGSPGPAARTLQ
jgi:S-formylglutathione hydrolase FrmB